MVTTKGMPSSEELQSLEDRLCEFNVVQTGLDSESQLRIEESRKTTPAILGLYFRQNKPDIPTVKHTALFNVGALTHLLQARFSF